MLSTNEAISDEIGSKEIPMDLLEIVTEGGRPEEFNRRARENTETELRRLREKTQDVQGLNQGMVAGVRRQPNT